MHKLILPSILVLGIFAIGLGSSQEAFAQVDCTNPNSATLEANALYVSTRDALLYKVHGPTLATCLIGQMASDPSNPAVTAVACKDVAIDHADPNGQLYCLSSGTALHQVDRVTSDFDLMGNPTAAGAGSVIDTTPIGTLRDTTNGNTPFGDANALEIDNQGRAYLAGGGAQSGKFYNLDLTTGNAVMRVDFNAANPGFNYISSGDLARDETTTNHMYWTVFCSGLAGTADACTLGPDGIPATGDENNSDRLYRILLNTPGCAGPCGDTLVTLGELARGQVFAMDIASPTLNLCHVTSDGFLFETDRDGNLIGIVNNLADPNIRGFGATGNNIGGTILMINTMSLLIAAGQTNATWLVLLAISGVAVVAYQFKDKIKTKDKKIND